MPYLNMPLFAPAAALLVTGSATSALVISRKKANRSLENSLPYKLNNTLKIESRNFKTVLAEWAEQYKAFCKKYIDPLVDYRKEDDEFETVLPEHLEEFDKALNRRLILPAIVLGSATSALILPPLSTITVIAGGALVLEFYIWAYDAWQQRHQLETLHQISVYITLGALAGFLVPISLGALLYTLGEKLALQVRKRSRGMLVNVFGQQPQMVWALIDGVEVEVPFEEIAIGMILVVSAGEVIASDGVIVSGDAAIDEQMLTGEAQPAEKSVGETVWATTIVLSGRICVQVDKAGEETVASDIFRILNETVEYQTEVGTKAVAIANKSVLPMLSLSALTIPFIGIQGGIALLGTNHTINLNLLGPINMLNFLNQAARNDVLIKDAQALERLCAVDTVVFDKTGTLTVAQPTLTAIYTYVALSEDEVLSLAASAESKQSHPIAEAIREAARSRNVATEPLTHAQYDVGYGLKVTVQQGLVHVGSLKYMRKEEIDIPPMLVQQAEAAGQMGNSLVVVALNEQVVGALELRPTTRPEAVLLMNQLRERGLSIYVLSGDQEAPTKQIAKELEMSGYFASVLPEEKAQVIKRLKAEGKTVCFIGDGINDSLALKSADVSISLRGATTAATDTAQIILLNGTLDRLSRLFEIAHSFNQNEKAAIGTVIFTSAAAIGGILFLNIGILAAELIFVGSTLAGLGIVSLPALQNRGLAPVRTDQPE